MLTRRLLLITAAGLLTAAAQNASLPYPPQFTGAKAEVYKTVGGTPLTLYIFEPASKEHANNAGASDPVTRSTGGALAPVFASKGTARPAIVFFFGGGWRNGSPAQFEGQCRRLASLGMVAITADYRVSSRNQSNVVDSIRDAKSAIRYVRQNAKRLGIDPQRIAAGGGSAGGHIAAAAAVIPGMDEDPVVSSKPNALVLFNPALSLTGGSSTVDELSKRPEFAGVDLVSVSPVEHVSKGAPPTIIFHGKADKIVPYATVEGFAKKSQAAGNRCELVGYEGQGHGFFNNRPGNRYYGETLRAAEEFLASLGYLDGAAAAASR